MSMNSITSACCGARFGVGFFPPRRFPLVAIGHL